MCIDENCKDHILEPLCSKCLDDKTVPNHGKLKKHHVNISINRALLEISELLTLSNFNEKKKKNPQANLKEYLV